MSASTHARSTRAGPNDRPPKNPEVDDNAATLISERAEQPDRPAVSLACTGEPEDDEFAGRLHP